jgi:competence protein ComEC
MLMFVSTKRFSDPVIPMCIGFLYGCAAATSIQADSGFTLVIGALVIGVLIGLWQKWFSLRTLFVLGIGLLIGATLALAWGLVRPTMDVKPTAQIQGAFIVVRCEKKDVSIVQDKNRHRFLLRNRACVPGEELSLRGIVHPPESFMSDAGHIVRYDLMLWRDGISGTIRASSVKLVGQKQFPLYAVKRGLQNLHEYVSHILERAIPGRSGGLIAGFVIGEKEGLSKQDQDVFRIAGLSHLVVLSGYNVTLVLVMTMQICALFLGYRARRLGALMVVALLVLISGAEPPALRAGVTAAAFVLADLLGRPRMMGRVLLIVAVVLVALSPRTLLYDVSFQLSFLATLGLVYLSPIVAKWKILRILPLRLGVRQGAEETISAQIAVTPLILASFGTFPLYGIVANILVVPLVPILTIGGIVTLFVGTLSQHLALLPGHAVSLGGSVVLWVAEFFATLPGALIKIPQLSGFITIILFSLVVVWVVKYKKSPSV